MNTHADWIDTTQPIDLSLEAGGCAHTHHLHSVLPSSKGCQECLKDGSAWVHLRVCMECGHVGCCDSSPGKHATGHFHATQHPHHALHPTSRKLGLVLY